MTDKPVPPGSYGLPFIGETIGWVRNPEAWVKAHLRNYGSIFKTRVMGRRVVVMLGPRANRFILWSHREHFQWGGGYGVFVGGLFPGSLSMEDGELHQRHRGLLAPWFRGKAVENYYPIVSERIRARIRQWSERDEITAFDECRRLTLDMVARALIGPAAEGQTDRLAIDFETLSRGLLTPFKWDLPWMTYGRALRARLRLKAWISGAMERARESDEDNLLTSLVRGQRGSRDHFTSEEMAPHILGLLFDGQDTTGSMMTWLLLELERHPQALQRLREEVGNGDGAEGAGWEEIAGFKYLDAVVQEIGRLHHPAPALPRMVVKEFEFDGYRVPEGTLVLYSPAASHRMPEAFERPEEFDPERFLPPREEHKREPFGLVTFGGGPRACLGAPLALMELKVLAVALARGYRWEVVKGQDLRPRFFATKRPRSGLRLRVNRLEI